MKFKVNSIAAMMILGRGMLLVLSAAVIPNVPLEGWLVSRVSYLVPKLPNVEMKLYKSAWNRLNSYENTGVLIGVMGKRQLCATFKKCALVCHLVLDSKITPKATNLTASMTR